MADLEIEKILTLSTAHIRESTAEAIDNERLPIIFFPKGEYGWFIYIGYSIFMSDQVPPDLFACMNLARQNGCVWLCLDRDGPLIDKNPKYEW